MKIELNAGTFKSISSPFCWDNIPQFAVITGENGTGKTQLLELIASQFDQNIRSQHQQYLRGTKFSITEENYNQHDVVFFRNFSEPVGSPVIGINEISNDITNICNHIRNNSNSGNPFEQSRLVRIRSILDGKKIDKATITENRFSELFTNDMFYYDPNQLYRDVSFHLFNYHIDYIEKRAIGKSHEEVIKQIGDPPWAFLNELFSKSNLRYRFATPEGSNLRTRYQFKFIDILTAAEIQPQDLSSGEIAIIRLYLWLFIAKQKYTFPKLVLLDEPDSHLHPTLSREFVSAISEGIVKPLNTRVIMTTHRTDTVSFVPMDSLFEMYARPARVVQSTSKSQTISLLTSNLLQVIDTQRPVFVEDSDDVEFYQIITSIATTEKLAELSFQPCFIPASLKKSTNRQHGGCSAVRSWVRRLRSAGLSSVVKGIIDRDNNTYSEAGIIVLKRYSFENYLLDPLVVFAVLVDKGILSKLNLERTVKPGEECFIKALSQKDLQTISDYITNSVCPNLTPAVSDSERVPVSCMYSNNIELQIPKWLLDRKGHSLVSAFRSTWKDVHPGTCLAGLKRARVIPIELVDILVSI